MAYCPSELVLLMNMMRGINTHIYTMLYNTYIYHISYIHICIYIYTYINIHKILPPPKVSCSRLPPITKVRVPPSFNETRLNCLGGLGSGTWFPIGSWPFEPSSCGGTQEPAISRGLVVEWLLWGGFFCVFLVMPDVYLVWFNREE